MPLPSRAGRRSARELPGVAPWLGHRVGWPPLALAERELLHELDRGGVLFAGTRAIPWASLSARATKTRISAAGVIAAQNMMMANSVR